MWTDKEPRASARGIERSLEGLASDVVPVTVTRSAHSAVLRRTGCSHVDGSLFLQDLGSCYRAVNDGSWPRKVKYGQLVL